MALTSKIDNVINQNSKKGNGSGIKEIWLDAELYNEFGKTEYKGYGVYCGPVMAKGLILFEYPYKRIKD